MQAWNLPTGAKHSWSHRSCTRSCFETDETLRIRSKAKTLSSTSQASSKTGRLSQSLRHVIVESKKITTKKTTRVKSVEGKRWSWNGCPWDLAHLDHCPSHSQWVLEHLWRQAKFGEKRGRCNEMQRIYSVNMCEHVLYLHSTVQGAPSESDDSDLATKTSSGHKSQTTHAVPLKKLQSWDGLGFWLWNSLADAEAMEGCDKLWLPHEVCMKM